MAERKRLKSAISSTSAKRGELILQEGAEAWGDWIDPRDRFFDAAEIVGWGSRTFPTGRMDDRRNGRNVPVYSTEYDLDEIRAAGRFLLDSSPHAIGIVGALVNYTFGKSGFTYSAKAEPKKSKGMDVSQIVVAVQEVIDEFLDLNDWQGDKEKEIFRRAIRDGELFVGLWDCKHGICETRVIDPEQIRDPGRKVEGYDSSFGVVTDEDDIERVHGYAIKWDVNRPTADDFMDACDVAHLKRNVDSKLKRGISDFFAVESNIMDARKLLTSAVRGAGVQAAIPFVRQHAAGTTQAQVETMRSGNATGAQSVTDRRGINRTTYQQSYRPGTVLDVPKGMEYLGSPMANGEAARSYIEVLQAGLRSIGTRWNAPEYLISGDASNANYSSTMVAESPFVKAIESEQGTLSKFFLRILWRVIGWACQCGRIPVPFRDVKRVVQISIGCPDVAVRDREKETNRRKVLVDGGIMSKKTWATEEDLDFEEEQANGALEKVEPPPMLSGGGFGGGGFGGNSGNEGGFGGQDGQNQQQQNQQPPTREDANAKVAESAVRAALESVRTTEEAVAVLRSLAESEKTKQ